MRSFFHLRLRSAYRRFSEVTPLRGYHPSTNRMAAFLSSTNDYNMFSLDSYPELA